MFVVRSGRKEGKKCTKERCFLATGVVETMSRCVLKLARASKYDYKVNSVRMKEADQLVRRRRRVQAELEYVDRPSY